MSEAGIQIALIFLMIFANGLFAMAEIALVSAKKNRLQQRAEEGDANARAALDLAEQPNRMLSTVQIGISLIGVFSGALGGATLSVHLAAVLAQVEWLAPYAETIALIIVVLIITYFSLVLGELIPKRLAMNNPEALATKLARPMRFLARVNAPLVSLLSSSTETGLKLMGVRPNQEPPVSDDEIRVLMQQGADEGIFEEAEQEMVAGVFRLSNRTADMVMTPRTEIEWLNLQDPLEDNLSKVSQTSHARYPVGDGNLDNIVGVVNARDLYKVKLSDGTADLSSLLEPVLFIPESTPALKMLEEIKKSGRHMALIIDEFGGVLGMVTMLDILESIVGDIRTAYDDSGPQAVQRADGSWLLDGLMAIDDLKDLLDLDELPDEERVGYQTLGGMVMSRLSAIPVVGQAFDWKNWHFEVVDMDGRRVDKVLAMPNPQTPDEAETP